MQIVRQRLFKTKTIVESSLMTLKSLQAFFRDKAQRSAITEYLLDDLDGLIHSYESHQLSIIRLLHVADGTMTLVSSLLDSFLPHR
jgi:hypothetical protein